MQSTEVYQTSDIRIVSSYFSLFDIYRQGTNRVRTRFDSIYVEIGSIQCIDPISIICHGILGDKLYNLYQLHAPTFYNIFALDVRGFLKK